MGPQIIRGSSLFSGSLSWGLHWLQDLGTFRPIPLLFTNVYA